MDNPPGCFGWLAPDVQKSRRSLQEANAVREASVRDWAKAGDEKAALYLALGRSLRETHPGPRKRRSSPSWITENDFNPSQVLASLERRGMVSRQAVEGGGSAALTDTGRHLS